jgi:hypothetical protein
VTNSKSQVWTEDDVCEIINASINYGLGKEEQILNKIENADSQLFSGMKNTDSVNIPDCVTEEKIRDVLKYHSNNGENQINKLARTIIREWSMSQKPSANSNQHKVMADGGVFNFSKAEKRLYYLSLSVINSVFAGYTIGSGDYIAGSVISIILAFCIVMYLVNSDFEIDVSIKS